MPGTIACQTLDFCIRFRSDVWPGQRDGRRLFRYAVPGCFPDWKDVLWLVLCAWNSGFACQNLDVFIGSGVTFGRPEGRQSRRGATMRVFWLALCALEQWNCLPEPCFFHSVQERRLAWRGTAVLFRHAVPGCFPDSCQNLDFFIWFRSDVWPGQRDGRRPWSTPWSTPWSHHPHVCFCTLISTLPITDKHRI